MSDAPPGTKLARHGWGAAFWVVLTLVIVVLNPLLMGLPGILLFGIGDILPRVILGPTILPDFRGDAIFDISTSMSVAWPVGGFVLWASFAWHEADKAWSIRKWLLFLPVLLAWNVGLSVYLHLHAVSADADDRSPEPELVRLADGGDLKAVKALIAGGAKVDVRKACMDSPLIAAAGAGHAQVVEVLLQAGARVDFRGSCQMPESLLCTAAVGGSLEAVRMLLQRGAPPNDFDARGRTPLMCAAGVGNLEVMKFLLENGADIHTVGRGSVYPPPIDTALMHAAMRGRPQATQLLLERGARVNEKGRWGFTALAYAARGRDELQGERGISAQDYPGTVRNLLQHGADPSIKDDAGKTALQHARAFGRPEIIELLEAASKDRVAVSPPK